MTVPLHALLLGQTFWSVCLEEGNRQTKLDEDAVFSNWQTVLFLCVCVFVLKRQT